MKQIKKAITLFAVLTLLAVLSAGCNQKSDPVDADAFASVKGEYQCIEKDINYMHLSISDDFEEFPYHLSIYDNAAGNPGVEGEIIHMDDSVITIQIDMDLFDEMPPGWQEDEETLTMGYHLENDGIVLGNQGVDVRFQAE